MGTDDGNLLEAFDKGQIAVIPNPTMLSQTRNLLIATPEPFGWMVENSCPNHVQIDVTDVIH
jgi:hypothetical protein